MYCLCLLVARVNNAVQSRRRCCFRLIQSCTVVLPQNHKRNLAFMDNHKQGPPNSALSCGNNSYSGMGQGLALSVFAWARLNVSCFPMQCRVCGEKPRAHMLRPCLQRGLRQYMSVGFPGGCRSVLLIFRRFEDRTANLQEVPGVRY